MVRIPAGETLARHQSSPPDVSSAGSECTVTSKELIEITCNTCPSLVSHAHPPSKGPNQTRAPREGITAARRGARGFHQACTQQSVQPNMVLLAAIREKNVLGYLTHKKTPTNPRTRGIRL